MADDDFTTGVPAPIPLLDELACLASAYEAFYLLAQSEDGQSSPVPTVLAELNNRLRSIVDGLDAMGLLS
jgi:hypothetical protein